jgi:hypothetical protein
MCDKCLINRERFLSLLLTITKVFGGDRSKNSTFGCTNRRSSWNAQPNVRGIPEFAMMASNFQHHIQDRSPTRCLAFAAQQQVLKP